MTYQEIIKYAEELKKLLAPYCKRIEIAGSIRRQKPGEIKDIEIVAMPDKWKLEAYLNGLKARYHIHYTKNGALYKSFKWQNQKVDLFIASPENFGFIFLIRTGSADFNKRLLMYYRKKYGFLSDRNDKGEYIQKASIGGFLRDTEGNKINTPEEIDVFKLVDCDFVEPVKRNDRNERY